MIVVLTETAIEDLVAIGRRIAEHNPQRAKTFVADLKSRCQQLGTMPKAFALVPAMRTPVYAAALTKII